MTNPLESSVDPEGIVHSLSCKTGGEHRSQHATVFAWCVSDPDQSRTKSGSRERQVAGHVRSLVADQGLRDLPQRWFLFL